jgi:hypothetical protein
VATNMQARALLKSLALHAVVAGVVLALPAGPLRRSAQPDEVDVVFHPPPPPVDIPPAVIPPLPRGGVTPAGPKTAHATPAPPAAPSAPAEPLAASTPGFPDGAAEAPAAEPPRPKVGTSGILAFRDQIASVAEDQNSIRLGAMAHLKAAADASSTSPNAFLLNAVTNGSGGINAAGLTRSVGGGARGGGSMHGVAIGRATDSLSSIGGGGAGPRALTAGGSADGTPGRGGPGPARTDEEIQIVFDRHKASFYRLYHQELRNDPTLKGQMVLRLTIEPDGTVSMCTLQSTDMHAPGLAAQVVDRVRGINFGAKEGVEALTIVYPIDFLPAA